MSEQPPVPPPTKRAKIAAGDDGGGNAGAGDGKLTLAGGDPFLAQAQAIQARHPLVDGHNDLAWALGNRVRLAKGNAERHAVHQQTLTYQNSIFVARSINNPRMGTSRALLVGDGGSNFPFLADCYSCSWSQDWYRPIR